MRQEHVLAEEEQEMTVARTKQNEEEKHTGMQSKGGDKEEKKGSKAKSKKIVLKIVTKLPVSATNPSRVCEEVA